MSLSDRSDSACTCTELGYGERDPQTDCPVHGTHLLSEHRDSPVRVEDCGDHLMLWIPIGEARVRFNRYHGDLFFVEAVEWDGGELPMGDGFSPQLDDVEAPADWEGRLTRAVDGSSS